MATTRTIAPRISEYVTQKLIDLFPSKTKGAEIAIEAFIHLRQAALSELKGIFSQKEILALVEALTGSKLVPEYQVDMRIFRNKMLEAEQNTWIFSRHDIEYRDLRDKIERLTSAQVFFLQCEIYCYLKSDLSKPTNLLTLLL